MPDAESLRSNIEMSSPSTRYPHAAARGVRSLHDDLYHRRSSAIEIIHDLQCIFKVKDGRPRLLVVLQALAQELRLVLTWRASIASRTIFDSRSSHSLPLEETRKGGRLRRTTTGEIRHFHLSY